MRTNFIFLIFHLYFSFNTRPRLDFSCIFEKIIFKYIHLCYNVYFYAANPIAFGYGLMREGKKNVYIFLSVLGRLKSLMLSTARAQVLPMNISLKFMISAGSLKHRSKPTMKEKYLFRSATAMQLKYSVHDKARYTFSVIL